MKWDFFVDFVTIVWLTLFIMGLTNTTDIPDLAVNLMLVVFVADLVVKYRREPDLRTFLRRRWIDILLVIPWFRPFRILRFVRVLRLLRIVLQAERFRRKMMRLVSEARRVKSARSKGAGET